MDMKINNLMTLIIFKFLILYLLQINFSEFISNNSFKFLS